MINISKTEIVVQILETANTSSGDYDVDDDGVMQTKIFHNTPLTSAQLKEYLKVLIERDLALVQHAIDSKLPKKVVGSLKFTIRWIM